MTLTTSEYLPALPIWLQQRDESTRAYQAARIYFDLRAARSLAAVAQKLSKSVTLMKRWSARWAWVERAEAFDLYMDTAEIEATRLQTIENAKLWMKREHQIQRLKYENRRKNAG